jgi:hypothetical protein
MSMRLLWGNSERNSHFFFPDARETDSPFLQTFVFRLGGLTLSLSPSSSSSLLFTFASFSVFFVLLSCMCSCALCILGRRGWLGLLTFASFHVSYDRRKMNIS